ncbi:MAG: hypothetical protein Ct9H300mP20_14350 [Gammaproteobacteria bacterium]|nr:MAG: hypothetical protein Ct9H300mP20_14350 [Gammaproteobacteria bacterium]
MSWNGNDNNKDPWGRKNGPPDIDEAIDQFKKKLGGIFGGSGGSGPGFFSQKEYFFWFHTSGTYRGLAWAFTRWSRQKGQLS